VALVGDRRAPTGQDGRMQIRIVTPAEHDSLLPGLIEVLRDSVASGASVGYVAPPEPAEAARWWTRALAGPDVLTWVAVDGGSGGPQGEAPRVVGTVQLMLPWQDNGRHRGEIVKLMVHRRTRGQGIGGRLLDAAEEEASRLGRWLLILNTRTGGEAEAIYTKRGWDTVAVIPDFATGTDGRLYPTTLMTKVLPH
jgi:GNAT superfamily N-acetyltransferase